MHDESSILAHHLTIITAWFFLPWFSFTFPFALFTLRIESTTHSFFWLIFFRALRIIEDAMLSFLGLSSFRHFHLLLIKLRIFHRFSINPTLTSEIWSKNRVPSIHINLIWHFKSLLISFREHWLFFCTFTAFLSSFITLN